MKNALLCFLFGLVILCPDLISAQVTAYQSQPNFSLSIGWQGYWVRETPFRERVIQGGSGNGVSGLGIVALQTPQIVVGYHIPLNPNLKVLLRTQIAGGIHRISDLRNINDLVNSAAMDLRARRALMQINAGAVLLYEFLPYQKFNWALGVGIGLNYHYHEYRDLFEVFIDGNRNFIEANESYSKKNSYSPAYVFIGQMNYLIKGNMSLRLEPNVILNEDQDLGIGANLGLQFKI